MAGAIKILSFSEGTSVTAPSTTTTHAFGDQYDADFTAATVFIGASDPRLTMYESDQAADGKAWDIQLASGVWTLRTRTDSDGSGTTALTSTRAGAVTLGASGGTQVHTVNGGLTSTMGSTSNNVTLSLTPGTGSSSTRSILNSTITAGNDSGTQPLWEIQAERSGGAAVTTRPLLKLFNYTTEVLSVAASGAVKLGPSSPGSSVLHVIDGYNSSTGGGAATTIYNRATNTGSACVEFVKGSSDTTTSHRLVVFTVNNGASGSGQINANGAGAAAFGTFSDVRLKTNVSDLSPTLDKIMRLRPVSFDYKAGGSQIGFIAQEMQEVFPDAVGYEEDEQRTMTLTGWSKTEARLVKAIQELAAKVEALES